MDNKEVANKLEEQIVLHNDEYKGVSRQQLIIIIRELNCKNGRLSQKYVDAFNELSEVKYERDTLKADNETKDNSIKAFIEDKERLNSALKVLDDETKSLKSIIVKKDEEIISQKDVIKFLQDNENSYKEQISLRDDKISELEKIQKHYKNTKDKMALDIEKLHTTIKKMAEVLSDV